MVEVFKIRLEGKMKENTRIFKSYLATDEISDDWKTNANMASLFKESKDKAGNFASALNFF